MRLSEQVKQKIIRDITEGRLSPGAVLPTELELVERENVSRNTIRQALAELSKEGYVTKIQGRGTFVSEKKENSSESVLFRKTSSKLIGIVMTFSDNYLNSMVNSIERILKIHGFNLVIANSNSRLQEEEAAIRNLLEQGIQGLFLIPCKDFEQNVMIKLMDKHNFPYLFLMRHRAKGPENAVFFNDFQGSMDIVSHIIRMGYKRVAFWGGPHHELPPHSERFRGYREALAAANIEYDPDLVIIEEFHDLSLNQDNLYQNKKVETMRKFLGKQHCPLGMFVINDSRVLPVMEAAEQLGLKIPEDLGIAGYDDQPYASLMKIPLTTVKQDILLLGETGARRLIEMIMYPDCDPQQIMLPVFSVIRQSCNEADHK